MSNYLKGVTTSERFGRKNRSDTEYTESEGNYPDFNAHRSGSSSQNGIVSSSKSDYNSEVRRPSRRLS
jgi:hypothetical protein